MSFHNRPDKQHTQLCIEYTVLFRCRVPIYPPRESCSVPDCIFKHYLPRAHSIHSYACVIPSELNFRYPGTHPLAPSRISPACIAGSRSVLRGSEIQSHSRGCSCHGLSIILKSPPYNSSSFPLLEFHVLAMRLWGVAAKITSFFSAAASAMHGSFQSRMEP